MDRNVSTAALLAIPIAIEHASGNVEPLLHEIRHALALLLETGTSTCIDLKSIPLAPGEEERIVQALGTGEVRVDVAVLGSTEIVETAFAGVWRVTHLSEHGETQAHLIEVTFVPEILRSQPEDVADALVRLNARLNVAGGG